MTRIAGMLMRFVVLFAAVVLLNSPAGKALAQVQPAGPSMHISAESAPYGLHIDGKEGSFTQKAFAGNRDQRYTVAYLHTDAGPTGYSKHLAWFLARDFRGYALLWCYLDDSGKDFWCWLYRYPENLLTIQHFTGEYTYVAPTSAVDTMEPGFSPPDPPAYTGPNFVFPGWTPKGGAIDKLNIYESLNTEHKSVGELATPDAIPSDKTPARTLDKLVVLPLHQLQVGGANGWRTGGWEELHAFARDSKKDPYYLILYSNSKLGFVIDLARGRTFTADFGAKVSFVPDQKSYGPQGKPEEHVELPTVKRNQGYELAFTSTKAYDNAFTDVVLDVEVNGPDSRTVRLPGFWDGGKNWKVRFTPTKIGNWTWKTFSNDKDLDAKIGVVECTPESDPNVGFLHVHPYTSQSRHFAIGVATPFYTSYIYDPVQYDPMTSATPAPKPTKAAADSKARGVIRLTADAAQSTAKMPASYIAFQNRMDVLHGAGFNRLTGGYVMLGDTALGEPKNEGGNAFVGGDLFHLNPEYFQWMDKRIAYCNSIGMIPDIGIARSPAMAFSANNDAQLRSLWRYLLARYNSYDVCWNMFGAVAADNTAALTRIQPFALMQGKYDLFHHPLSTSLIITPAYIAKATAVPVDTKDAKTPNRNSIPDSVMIPLGLPLWLDVLTVQTTDPTVLYALDSVKKPIIQVTEAPPTTDAAARAEVWAARMRSAYYTTDATGGPAPSTSDPIEKAKETADKFFKQIHFGRLEPHNELLQAREESAEAAKRRHLANIQAGIPVNTGDPIPPGTPSSALPVLLLADISREYVLYFKHGGNATLDLLEATGRIQVSWLNLTTGESKEDNQIVGGAYHAFTAPDDKDWVLYLKRL